MSKHFLLNESIGDLELLSRKLVSFLSIVFVYGISIIFTHIFFLSRNLYNNEAFLYLDHGGQLSFSMLLGKIIIPIFNASYGYTQALYVGFPGLGVYSIGYFFIVYLVTLLGFSYEIAYKIILFCLMVNIGVFPYWILKNEGISNFAGIISSLWMWVGMESLIITRIHTGATPFLLSALIAMVFLYYTQKIDFSTKISISKKIIPIFLLFLVAFINETSTIFIAIIVIEQIIIVAIRDRRIFSPIVKKLILFYIEIVIGALLLYCFWLLPLIFIQWPYIRTHTERFIFSYQFSLEFNENYLKKTWLSLISIFVVVFFLIREKKKGYFTFYLLIAISSLIICFIVPLFNFSLFLGANIYKFLVFFEFSASLFVGYLFDILGEQIKKGSLWLKLKENKYRFNVKERKRLVGMLLLAIFSFIGVFPFTHSNIYKLYPYGSLNIIRGNPNQNYNDWSNPDKALINWIKANTSIDSRILFQGSSDLTGDKLSGGHNILYLALSTNRSFATGYTSEWYWFYRDSINSSFVDDILFGRNISSYNVPELENYFILYNIEFIILWSQNAKNFFDSVATSSNILELIQQTPDYSYYHYLNATRSYIINKDLLVKNFTQNENQMRFVANNFDHNRTIILSMHDYPNWNVYINGSLVDKAQNPLDLITFTIPEQYTEDILIDVKWEKMTVQYFSETISALVFVILLIIFSKNIPRKGTKPAVCDN